MLRKGAILEYKRLGGLFYHYAMYIGNNKVIHRDKNSIFMYGHIYITDMDKVPGKMRIVPLITHIPHVHTEKAIETALELFHKDNTYNILTNNCEHFVNYLRYEKQVSNQIQRIKKCIIISLYMLLIFNTHTIS